ncbi:MAG: MBL fold metallo-hydrolase [Verrucomicrobiaceae bacterium]|nr:MBL fold metallo-hydrolase [Verrucomicrobiaceae bacterium]
MISTFTGGIAATNGYLLELPGGKLLIDAPEGITDWLKRRDFTPSAVFLTHQHFDHVMDAAKVKAAFGCPLIAWAPYSRDLTLETLFGMATGSTMSVPPYEIDQVIGGQTSIELWGLNWSVFHIPGHSPDSACIYHALQNLLFAGDVLFQGSIGRTDFPGGSMETLVTGIQRDLWPLPDSTTVYPGHGDPTTIGEEREMNPYCS